MKKRQFVSTPQGGQSSSQPVASDSTVAELYNKLFKYREKLSEDSEQQLSTYMIATNKNLLDIAKQRPTTLDSLRKIDSLPEKRAELLGDGVLNLIKEFSEEHKIDTDVFDSKPSSQQFIKVQL